MAVQGGLPPPELLNQLQYQQLLQQDLRYVGSLQSGLGSFKHQELMFKGIPLQGNYQYQQEQQQYQYFPQCSCGKYFTYVSDPLSYKQSWECNFCGWYYDVSPLDVSFRMDKLFSKELGAQATWVEGIGWVK